MSIKTVFFDWGGVIAPDPGDDFLSSLLRRIGANDEQIQEMYDIALQKIHTTAQESLFIDDKQTFLDPAVRIFFRTILARNSEQIINDVQVMLLSS